MWLSCEPVRERTQPVSARFDRICKIYREQSSDAEIHPPRSPGTAFARAPRLCAPTPPLPGPDAAGLCPCAFLRPAMPRNLSWASRHAPDPASPSESALTAGYFLFTDSAEIQSCVHRLCASERVSAILASKQRYHVAKSRAVASGCRGVKTPLMRSEQEESELCGTLIFVTVLQRH